MIFLFHGLLFFLGGGGNNILLSFCSLLTLFESIEVFFNISFYFFKFISNFEENNKDQILRLTLNNQNHSLKWTLEEIILKCLCRQLFIILKRI